MLILKGKHPARSELQKYTNVITPKDAAHADIRALRLGVLNLMPVMDETEKDLLRSLSHSILQIEPVWIKMATYEKTGKHTSLAHIHTFYQTMEQATAEQNLDGLIVTGAPIEHIDFKDIYYWKELQQIMDYAKEYIYSTLYLCWAAMAVAFYHYGVNKIEYPKKLTGIFAMDNVHQDSNPFTLGMDPVVLLCQSRHTGIDQQALAKKINQGKLVSLFQSQEKPRALAGKQIGITVFAAADNSFVANLGHFEYHAETIDQEVKRDVKKKPPLVYPVEHYYKNPKTKTGIPAITWKSARTLFYENFLHVMYNRMNTMKQKRQAFTLSM